MKVKFFNRLPVRLAGVILLMGFIAVPIVSELKRRAVERLVLQQAEVQAATATIANSAIRHAVMTLMRFTFGSSFLVEPDRAPY